ncbi:hypothetical protein [Flavobacterium eburneipallidum]|uniref:hypothetical protein n=1 Tax=Flavobacterium eburneipallidum TaxID=3003263 RepID=UPI0024829212|nr:hypothetical protein [Flavobacterium eburneipallidum]
MKSKLNITEFRAKLTENTKIGLPQLRVNFGIFSIFFFNSKCFYGNFDDSTFRLTINYNFTSAIYILKGKYQNTDNKLKLNYTVEPLSKVGIIWMKYFPFVALIGVNSFFYFNFNNTPIFVYILFNLFTIFSFLHLRWSLKRENKKLVQKFNKIFEVIE